MKRWKPKLSGTGVFELEAELTAPVSVSKCRNAEKLTGREGPSVFSLCSSKSDFQTETYIKIFEGTLHRTLDL